MPGAWRMPSCAKAQSCTSTAGAYSRLSASIASMPARRTIGSTSTCARIAVVPAATARSRTRRARASMSAAVKPRFAIAVSRIASAAVSAEPDTRSPRSALSRWMCASTRPGVTSRPPTSTVSRAGSRARPMPTMRPSAIARSIGAPPAGTRQLASRRSSIEGQYAERPAAARAKRPPHAAVRGRPSVSGEDAFQQRRRSRASSASAASIVSAPSAKITRPTVSADCRSPSRPRM